MGVANKGLPSRLTIFGKEINMNIKKEYANIICVCFGKKCKKNGAKDIYRGLKKSLNGKRNDLKNMLIKTKCLDHCDSGPIVIKDNLLYLQFNPEDI